MPLHQPTGFSLAISIPRHDPTSSTGTRLVVLPELAVAAAGDLELTCYVEALPSTPFRVFFDRNRKLKPVQGLECYVAFLHVDDNKPPWTKVYGLGEGVDPEGCAMFLDGTFGEAPIDLANTIRKKVYLRLHRCTMKPGTVFGCGQLLAADVGWMDENSCLESTWMYASREHLLQLGVIPDPSEALGAGPTTLEASQDPANDFLRLTNSLLISRLTPSQRVAFLEKLSTSPSLVCMLSPTTRDELNTLRQQLARQAASAPLVAPVPAAAATTVVPPRTSTQGEQNRRPSPVSIIPSLSVSSDTGGPIVLSIARPSSGIRSPTKPTSRPQTPRRSPLSEVVPLVEVEQEKVGYGVEKKGEIESQGKDGEATREVGEMREQVVEQGEGGTTS